MAKVQFWLANNTPSIGISALKGSLNIDQHSSSYRTDIITKIHRVQGSIFMGQWISCDVEDCDVEDLIITFMLDLFLHCGVNVMTIKYNKFILFIIYDLHYNNIHYCLKVWDL